MASKKGNLSINSENMFPIIKKWLYSDHDIFYREVISNACDAVTKIRKMDMMGEYELPEGFKPRVDVVLNDKVVMPYNHLILCHPLLLLPANPPSIRVFSNESTLRMRWPKYWIHLYRQ